MHLSKSDFKVARTCGTKLYYKKLRYPSKQDDDPYLEFLADGGYMIETIAKLLFPEGREIEFDSNEAAVELTRLAKRDEQSPARRLECASVTAKRFTDLLALFLVLELIDKIVSLGLAIRHSAREFPALGCCGYFTEWITSFNMLS